MREKCAKHFLYDYNRRSLHQNLTSRAREGERAYEVNKLILKMACTPAWLSKHLHKSFLITVCSLSVVERIYMQLIWCHVFRCIHTSLIEVTSVYLSTFWSINQYIFFIVFYKSTVFPTIMQCFFLGLAIIDKNYLKSMRMHSNNLINDYDHYEESNNHIYHNN